MMNQSLSVARAKSSTPEWSRGAPAPIRCVAPKALIRCRAPIGAGTPRLHSEAARAGVAIVLVALFVGVFVASRPGPTRADDAPAALTPASKPKVAVFPLGGDAPDDTRSKYGYSLRTKLDRDATYAVIDGPAMADLAVNAEHPITFDTPADEIKALGRAAGAAVLMWGDVSMKGKTRVLKLHVLDLREKDPKPRALQKEVVQATDLRFVAEEILKTLPGVKDFEHPNKEEVRLDPKSLELWAKNPNLVNNSDFSDAGCWDAIYLAEKYPVKISDRPPEVDRVNIYRMPAGEAGTPGDKPNTVLAMNLSRTCAENNGMACLSDAIKIEPHTRYRLQFRYKSDGPTLHVFVKGYTPEKNIKGETVMREVYRRQVSPSGATGGRWRTVLSDLNPQHVAYPVKELRVDLYAYLSPGAVYFDDVVLKAVGDPTDVARDDAIKAPVTKPASRKE